MCIIHSLATSSRLIFCLSNLCRWGKGKGCGALFCDCWSAGTLHSESIQTSFIFVMLQPDSGVVEVHSFLIDLHSVSHDDKVKTNLNVCKFVKKGKTETSHWHKYSDPSLSTLLKHLWQQLQLCLFGYDTTSFTYLDWGIFCYSSLHSSFKLSHVGWWPLVDSLFWILPEMLSRVRQSSGWATLGHSQSCP